MGVGLVVVSHSRVLADAAVALASEMLHGQPLRIAVAAGLDDTAFGTDATAIEAAVREVDDPAGVVVLMDLGSAVLSAEVALELLDPEIAARVLLCPAPLVEGLVVAAVSAAGGATREEVAAEALGSLAGKLSQLAPAQPPAAAAAAEEQPDAAPGSADVVRASFEVLNPHGLHARPAARLVQEVSRLDAVVRVRNLTTGGAEVSAGSLSRVATIGALAGHVVEVVASGPEAQDAVDRVLSLAARSFDEVAAPRPSVAQPDAGGSGATRPDGVALAASPGVAIGPARPLRTPDLVVPDEPAGAQADEESRLAVAIAAVRSDIQVARAHVARTVSPDEAAIFDAHLLLLDDPEVLTGAATRLEAGESALQAYATTVRAAEAALDALPDPYLRARAADVRAVGDQVLRHLVGVGAPTMPTDGVLVAPDLTPAQVAALDPATTGIVLAGASPTSHSAILARSKGIPMVVGAGRGVLEVVDGTLVGLDGTTGELHIDPDADVVATLTARRAERTAAYDRALVVAHEPATTQDGVQVLVGVNGAAPAEIGAGVRNGADVVGLVRTEFLFLGRDHAPDVDEQVAAYRALAEAAAGRRLTLRTLDVGGDKPLPYLPQPVEANPFLGLRGLRLALRTPALFAEQLRAIVTVAHETPVSVMFPMVSTLDELRAAREALDAAISVVGGHPPAGLQVGVMVEVPALALKAAAVAPYVDFFSVGTNDLTQYTMAAERGNDAVAELGDPLDPAVLRLVDVVCRAAGSERLVAVCGELAAEPSAAALLVGLGVRELSVSPGAVALVKEAVRATDTTSTHALVRDVLAAAGPAEVRRLLEIG